MRRNNTVSPLLWAALTLPVLYLAALLASGYEEGMTVFDLMGHFSGLLERPFAIRWTPHTPKFMLGALLIYGFSVVLYCSTRENRRPGEEHGSAKWGSPKLLDRKYRDKAPFQNTILTQNVRMGLNGKVHRRNLLQIVIGGSGAGKTRFFCKPNLMQANCSFLVTDPKGETMRAVAPLLIEKGYVIKVFDLIDTDRSDAFNPFPYLKDDKDAMKLVNNLIKNTTPKNSTNNDPFWEKSEIALDTALILYLLHEAPPEEQNLEMVMYMIENGGAREDDDDFQSPLDMLFEALEEEEPDHVAVREYKIFKQAAGVVCSKRLLNQAVGKSLRTHNLKPKKGAQVMRKNEKITALYERLSRDDFGKDDDQQRESNSISNQELLCRGWFLPPNTYDCGSFVVNGTAVVGKEAKSLITAANQHKKELIYMKSIFEQMGGTYRQEGDYLIPNLALPEEPEYQIGKYGRMRRSYLKEHRPVLYANLLTSGTLHRHLAEIDQACNERMEIIVSDMARQEDVTEALKAADQME